MFFPEFGRRGGCVTAIAGAAFIEVEEKELGPHRFNLLGNFGPHVERADNCTQRLSRTNGSQTGHARADNQHFGWGNFARCCDLTGEKAPEGISGLDHRPVSGNVCHRRQRIHFLGAGNPRHHFHGHQRAAGIGPGFEQFCVFGRRHEGNDGLPFGKLLGFSRRRRADLGDHVSFLPKVCRSADNGNTGCLVIGIRKTCSGAGALLNNTIETEFLQLNRRLRCHRNAVFVFRGFLGSSDNRQCRSFRQNQFNAVVARCLMPDQPHSFNTDTRLCTISRSRAKPPIKRKRTFQMKYRYIPLQPASEYANRRSPVARRSNKKNASTARCPYSSAGRATDL